MKKVLLSSVVCALLFFGCGNESSSMGTVTNTSVKAQFLDSPVIGLDYNTSSTSGITDDDGYFKFNPTDKAVTFSVGKLIIGTLDLRNLNRDGKVLPSDLFGLSRDNTTDDRIIKVIDFLQSLDSDNNPGNGITIDYATKYLIDQTLETNLSIKPNIVDDSIATLQYLVKKANKTWVLERTARDNYEAQLIALGITPVGSMPFSMVWSVGAGGTVTIPVNPNYTYNYNVDWGDGSVSENVTTTITHQYAQGGEYTVKITGDFPALYLNNDGKSISADYNYIGNADNLISITDWGDIYWKSFYHAFAGAGKLEILAGDTPILSSVTNMNSAFADTDLQTSSSLQDWNMSSVKDTGAMFEHSNFNQNIGNWNLVNDTNMSAMFKDDAYFNQPLETWNVSSVKDMSYMFNNAISFNQPLTDWLVNNVTDMSHMFDGAKSFDQNVTNWNVSSVKDMSYMFNNASNFNKSLYNWNVSNVTDMNHMFAGDKAFNQYIDNWHVSNVTNMSYMFEGTGEYNMPLNGWDVSHVTNMSHMFENTGLFNQSLNNWNVSNVTDMSYMFNNAALFNQSIDDWNVSNVTNMSYMFSHTSSFNQSLDKWNVSNVTDMSHMFDSASSFNQSLIYWNVSNVRDMSYMFSYSIFNQNIDFWNVSNVIDMSHMFYWANYFNQDISKWNVSNVRDMSYMFSYTQYFDQNISDWNVSNVTNMDHMFYYAIDFDQNLSNWDVSNVTDYTDFSVNSPIDGTDKMPKFK